MHPRPSGVPPCCRLGSTVLCVCVRDEPALWNSGGLGVEVLGPPCLSPVPSWLSKIARGASLKSRMFPGPSVRHSDHCVPSGTQAAVLLTSSPGSPSVLPGWEAGGQVEA